MFPLFSIEKMKPNHAEICRVGKEADFQQVSPVHFFINQSKRFSSKIKRQAKNVFPRDVERIVRNSIYSDP